MGKFAKVFEIGEEQLLVKTQQDAEGNPQVYCATEIDGNEIGISPTFTPKSDSDSAFESAWDAADKYFLSVDQRKAEEIRAGIVRTYETLSS